MSIPKVSVIILNWNQSDLTITCIDSVIKHAGDVSYEIIVVDNGSLATELHALASKIPMFAKLLPLSRNLYFGEANNIGAEAAQGEFLLFLNNDAFLTESVIEKLINVFDCESCVGAAGPKFCFSNGLIQEAGAFILPSGWTLQQGKGDQPYDDHFKTGNHAVDYCSAACLLVKRGVFLSVGGFDPLFDPAYFEDVDFALRIRSIGLFTYFCADVEVVHDENTTSSKVWPGPKLNQIAAVNHNKFFDRWGGYLERRLSLVGAIPVFQPLVKESRRLELRGGVKRVLICFSDLIVESEECVNKLRIASALAVKFQITLAPVETCSRARIHSLCRAFAIALDSFGLEKFSKDNLTHYDHVLFRSDDTARKSPFLLSGELSEVCEAFLQTT